MTVLQSLLNSVLGASAKRGPEALTATSLG